MAGDEILVEGPGVSQDKVEMAIRRHLGLPEPEGSRKGVFGKFFGG